MNSKKRIGLLIPGMSRGGAERVAAILTKILDDEFEVFLIVYHCTKMAYPIEVDIIDMNLPAQQGIIRSGINFVRRCQKMSGIINEYQLDAVISFLNSANLVNAFSKSNNNKIISIRSYEFDLNETADMKGKIFDVFYRSIERLMLQKVDKVVAVSRMIQFKLEQLYPNFKGKILTVYNPYEIESINARSQECVEDWNKYFDTQDFIFVTVGRLEQPKGLWHLTKIFRNVARENHHVKLLIIGDGSYRSKIYEFLQKENLTDRVILVGDQDNPFKFVAKANAYLLTSTREGFPNALVEAMACGIPVIANDCLSGPREILCNEVDYSHKVTEIEYVDYGILTPRLDTCEDWNNVELEPEERCFAEAMKRLMIDSQLLEFYSQQSEKRAMDFNCEVCRREYCKLV